MHILKFLFVFFIASPAFSQDYVRPESNLKEGIYLDYQDFLYNTPLEVKLVKKGSDIFLWNDSLKKEEILDPEKVWGYSINNSVYVNYEAAFWKLINKGKLNHFSAIVIRYYQTYDSFGFMVNRASKELAHLFFDIGDGKIKVLNKENFEKYFEEDPKLGKYYKKLNGNRTEKLILVLQAYNERHPQ